MELRFVYPPEKKTPPPQKKLSVLREKLIGERLANLNNPDYLRRRAVEYHQAGDKAAYLAYTLQAEAAGIFS